MTNIEAERAALSRMRPLPLDANQCPQCRGSLREMTEHTERGTGVIVMVLGLLLAPFCLGIPILIYGWMMVRTYKQYQHCAGCGRTFPV